MIVDDEPYTQQVICLLVLVSSHNRSTHGCKLQVLFELSYVWIENARGFLEVPSTWMNDKLWPSIEHKSLHCEMKHTIRVDAPITNHLRDFAPYLEKYKAMQMLLCVVT